MANQKKTLPSGAVLELQLASFEESNVLKRAVMKEIEAVRLNFGNVKGFKELFDADLTPEIIDTIKNVIARLIGSLLIEDALWPCMGRCLYRNQKISVASFEPEENRADYLLVVREVMICNLAPFFKSAGSLFGGFREALSENLK